MVRQKYLIGLLLILSIFIFACTGQEEQNKENITQQPPITDLENVNEEYEDTTNNDEENIKTFNVIGGPMFEFFIDDEKNADIIVNVGDRVRIVYESVGGMPHDFVIDEFDGARTQIWQPGEGEIIEFVADKTGTFEYYCSVGSHRANGMAGRFIVQE